MYYVVTIGYETEVGKEGKTKVVKTKYLLEAESVEEATIVANRYMADDTRDAELLGIAKSPISNLISPQTEPNYYK